LVKLAQRRCVAPSACAMPPAVSGLRIRWTGLWTDPSQNPSRRPRKWETQTGDGCERRWIAGAPNRAAGRKLCRKRRFAGGWHPRRRADVPNESDGWKADPHRTGLALDMELGSMRILFPVAIAAIALADPVHAQSYEHARASTNLRLLRVADGWFWLRLNLGGNVYATYP
jgi:hypothetical protein